MIFVIFKQGSNLFDIVSLSISVKSVVSFLLLGNFEFVYSLHEPPVLPF